MVINSDSIISLFTSLKEEIVLIVNLTSMRITGANEEAQRLLGYDSGELLNLKIQNIIDSFHYPDLEERVKKLPPGKRIYSVFLTRNSQKISVSFSMNIIPADGEKYGVIIGREMNLGAGTEGDTDFSPEKYMKVLDSIGEAIVVVDKDLKIRLYNAFFRHIAENADFKEEYIGMGLCDVAGFLTGKHSLEYKFVFQTGKSLTTSIRKVSDSKVMWFEVIKSPFIVNGEVTHVISVIRDTTKQQELEKAKKESVLQIEKNMEQFAILNDHIRNPLQAIVGLAELEGGHTAEKIIENALIIDKIVSELDAGWIESDKIREILLRHYGLKISGRSNISSPLGSLTFNRTVKERKG